MNPKCYICTGDLGLEALQGFCMSCGVGTFSTRLTGKKAEAWMGAKQ